MPSTMSRTSGWQHWKHVRASLTTMQGGRMKSALMWMATAIISIIYAPQAHASWFLVVQSVNTGELISSVPYGPGASGRTLCVNIQDHFGGHRSGDDELVKCVDESDTHLTL